MSADRHKGDPMDDHHDPALALLYRETAREIPPKRLDAAIRAAARRTINARPSLAGLPLRGWRAPFAIAAVLVLSVSLVVLMVEEGMDGRIPVPGGPPRETALPRANAPTDQPSTAAPASLPDVSAPSGPIRTEKPEDGTSAGNRRKPMAGTPGSVEASNGETESAVRGKSTRAGGEDSAGGASTPAPNNEAGQKGLTGFVKRSERTQASAPENQGPIVKKQVPPRRPLAAARGGASRDSAETRSNQRAPLADGAESYDPISSLLRTYEGEPPEKWIEKILELRREGHFEDATELLSEFRKRFPNYSLPSELRP